MDVGGGELQVQQLEYRGEVMLSRSQAIVHNQELPRGADPRSSRRRREGTLPVPAFSSRPVCYHLFPRQCRGSGPLLHVLHNHQGSVPGAHACRGVSRLWHLPRPLRRGWHHGKCNGRPEFCLRDASVALRRHQAAGPFTRHRTCGGSGCSVRCGRSHPCDSISEHQRDLQSSGWRFGRVHHRPFSKLQIGRKDRKSYSHYPWAAGHPYPNQP
mmetsp:Transcript_43537/g.78203  ORF Transcript_43537/g.78203 Transcript_43537/m.78203 type:complete len:213 (-) Transcript_43537:440-1078(-)